MPDPGPTVTPDPNAAAADWRAALPEDIRSHQALEKIKDVPGLARQLIETEKFIGQKDVALKTLEATSRDRVRIPGADAKPEDVSAYRKAMGIPETIAEYKVDVPEGLRSLVPLEMAAKFAPIFHAAHVPPAVAQKIVQAYAEHAQTILAVRQQEFSAGRDALKQEWGEATFERRSILAERAIEQLLSDAQIAVFNEAGLSGHPELFKLFASLGETMAEDGLISGEVTGGKTIATLEARKREIENDPDFWRESNPLKHEALVKEWNTIHAQLNPVAVH